MKGGCCFYVLRTRFLPCSLSLPQAPFCSYLLPALLQSPLSVFAVALVSRLISLIKLILEVGN